MDRVWVSASRRIESLEHALTQVARAAAEDTQLSRFRAFGARYARAQGDLASVVKLFREDAVQARVGHYTRLALRMDPVAARRLSDVEPRALERRLGDAVRDILRRELPRFQGVHALRFQPGVRERLEPVVHVFLSARLRNGDPAHLLGKTEIRRLEELWSRQVARLSRGERLPGERLVPGRQGRDRETALEPLRREWDAASRRLSQVYTARLDGRAGPDELRDAVDTARTARDAWTRSAVQPLNVRDVGTRQVLDVVRLRIEGGARYMSGPLEGHRRDVLEEAVARTAALADRPGRHVAVVPWAAGRDVEALVYFNQRHQSHREVGHMEPAVLARGLEEHLRLEVERLGSSLDRTADSRAHELGRVEVRLPERHDWPEPPGRSGPSPARDADLAEAALLLLGEERDRARAPGGSDERHGGERPAEAVAPVQPPPTERDWTSERVVTVTVPVPAGARDVERLGLTPVEVGEVLQRAVHRSFPSLETAGVRQNFLYGAKGKDLEVRILIPEALARTPGRAGEAVQQQFRIAFGEALRSTARAVPLRGLSGAISMARGDGIRRAEQEPEKAARELVRATFNKLTMALPAPFRIAREMSRTVGQFIRGRQ